MPTNLPPEYYKIEQEYRQASTPEEKAAYLEEMLSVIPKHKGTDKLRADLRKKLSKLKEASQTRKSVGKRDSVYHIDKEGAGQAVVVGPANVGKSALVAALTNATPEVAAYPYTTWTPTPGMMPVENIQIQLIDTPPLDAEYVEPQLLDLIRRADLMLLVVDLQAFPIEQLESSVALLEEHRIVPRQHQALFEGERRITVKPLIVLVNKTDDERCDADFEVLCELLEGDWNLIPVSAATGRHVDRLKWAVFEELRIMRVYSKPPGLEVDLSSPFVLERGSTVEEFAGKVHKDFQENLKTARLWGSGEFDGQMVGRDYVLQDGDVVELRI
jgi:ribosome-interacting GTPase 1